MSQPTIKQSIRKVKPQLKDLFDLVKKETKLEINCNHLATIQSYDGDANTCTAKINYQRTFFKESNGSYIAENYDFPVLEDIPVIRILGGATGLNVPIEEGDQCLLMFNDRSMDNWFAGLNDGPVSNGRLHSLSDGLALIGLKGNDDSAFFYDAERIVLYNGTTGVGVGSDKVKIYNSQYVLNALLQELITEVKNLVTQTAAITVSGVQGGGGISGPVVNIAAITAINADIIATATKIGDLLE